jgi:LysM repeat protein
MFINKKVFAAVTAGVVILSSAAVYSVNATYQKRQQTKIEQNYEKSGQVLNQATIAEVPVKITAETTAVKEDTQKKQTRVKNSNGTYTVAEGDTIWDIAYDFGTNPDFLKKVNGLRSDNLKIGKVLVFTEPVPKASNKNETVMKVASRGAKTTQTTVKATTKSSRTKASRGDASNSILLGWSEASGILSIGTVATVMDVSTGKSFKVKRTYGHNHADCEALTSDDTNVIRSIWGGWSWDRRPVVVQVGSKRIAASMTAMPHAGLDSAPALKAVSGRSGGYGSGTNLDAVKDNGMDGHIDIHFLNSKTHGSGKVDSQHQAAIKRAVGK